MKKNIRGAREFMIGAGANHPNFLDAEKRAVLGEWYGVTPADYAEIARSADRQRAREEHAKHRTEGAANKRAATSRRKRTRKGKKAKRAWWQLW